MKSLSAHQENKSLKTFFIYALIVLFFIILSLAIRAYYLIQQSRFDGRNQMVIAVGEDETVKRIISFDPDDRFATVLELQGEPVRFSSIGKQLSILPNATINTKGTIPSDADLSATMQAVLLNYYTIKTNLTIFDAIRLFFAAQKPALTNGEIKEIFVTKDDEENYKLLAHTLTDDAIFSENVSIQIVNASGVSGMGRRLERALLSRGGNVVSVATARDVQRSSIIQYGGEETYTLAILKQVLNLPVAKLEKEAIADIVIVIGEDQKNAERF